MALDSTVGGTSANSFGSLAEADAHFTDRPDAADWDALGSAQSAWLILATDRLSHLSYQGERTDDDQALPWPRTGAYLDGIEIDDDVIPPRLKKAQFNLALLLSADSDPIADTGLEGFERLKVDVIEIVPRGGTEYSAGDLPEDVLREVRPLLAGGGIHQFRIARG